MQISSEVKQVNIMIPYQEIIDGLKMEISQEQRRNFQNQFYYGTIKMIYNRIFQKCKNFSDAEQLAKDIVQESYISAFKGIQKFSLPITADPIDHPKIVIKWLIVIADNFFKKEYAKRINNLCYEDVIDILSEPSYQQLETESHNDETKITNPFRLKLQNALNLLTERERHIIIEYAGEECIDSRNHLSEKSMKYLCTLYETTPENIRQIKKRALDKIKKSCL